MVSYESTLSTVLGPAAIEPSPLHNILIDLANTIDRVRNDIVENAKELATDHAAYARNIANGFFTANSPAKSSRNENMIEDASRLLEVNHNFRELARATLTQDQWDEFNRMIRG